jgi:hypothetical protein
MIVGVEGIMDPVVAVVVSTTCYFHFVSYMSTLTTFGVVGLYWWRLSSSILPCIGSNVLLGSSSISYIVGDVAYDVSSGVGWRVGCGVSGSVGSKVDWLHYFVFTSSLFSYGLKGSNAATSLVRVLRPTPRVGACS